MLHPLAILRRNLLANPLARLTWGIDPRNGRRRRRALLTLLWPSALWLALSSGFAVWFWIEEWPQHEWWIILWLWVSVIGFAVTLILLVQSGLGDHYASRLRANWEELRLAGLSPAQIVVGLGGPRMMGLWLFALLQWMPICFFLAAFDERDGREAVVNWFFACMLTPSVYLLILAPLEIALWARLRSAPARAVLIFIASLASSPLVVILFVTFLSELVHAGWFIQSRTDVLLKSGPWLEIASWPLRLVLVGLFWRLTMARLAETNSLDDAK